jgi:hypothetical protein
VPDGKTRVAVAGASGPAKAGAMYFEFLTAWSGFLASSLARKRTAESDIGRNTNEGSQTLAGSSGLASAKAIPYHDHGGPHMNSLPKLLSTIAVSAIAFALMGASTPDSSYVPSLTMAHNAAMIFNPGGGDYAGFRIVVEPSGGAAAVDGAGRATSELQPDVVQKLFADLASAGPLDKLPIGDCASTKPDATSTSVEVNAAIVITWNGQHTPSLSCVTDPRAVKIVLDATTIQHALYVQAYRKRTMMGFGGVYAYAGTAHYQNSGYADDHFYVPRFQNDPFTFTSFQNDSFSFSNFNSGMQQSAGPYSSLPSAGQVFTSLPFSNPFTSPQSATIPFTSPYSSGPYSSFGSGDSPFSGGPSVSAPFSSGPTIVTH